MTPRPNCPASQFGCSCGNGPCKADPYQHLIVENSRLNLWLSIGVAVVFSTAAVLGYHAMARVAKAHEMEARV